jgi:rod shape-determining protein MreC
MAEQRSRSPLVLLAGLGVLLAAWAPARGMALDVFRAPLVFARAATAMAVRLPELPRVEQEQAAMRRALAEQQLELTRLREALRRTERLQELTRQLPTEAARVVSVIGRAIVPTEHVVILDRGAQQGMARDAVLMEARGLVGRVLDVHPATSTAMLLTDPDSRVACLIERTRELGLLVGTGGTLCRLDHLDADADVVPGDLVVTAGLDGPFPKGLVVGTVVKVLRDEQGATAQAFVRPMVNLRHVEEMLCLPPASSS